MSEHPSDELAEMSAAILSMSRQLDVRQALQTIVGTARRLLGARFAALGVPDDHGGFAQFVVDGVGDRQWRAIGPLPRRHGVLAAMCDGHPVRMDDVRTHPEFGGWPSAHPDMAGFLGVPVLDGEEVLGTLFLANLQHGGTFSERDEQRLRTFAAHAAIALTNARLYERSRELTLVGERTRIAQELHDAVAQKLFSLRLTVRAATELLDRDPERARRELAEVSDLAKQAADELRSVVVELRPAGLSEDGLLAVLRGEAELLNRAHSAEVRFRAERVKALPAAQEEAALRIAQEALHNALRHSGADTVQITLTGTDPGAVLRIADDGSGFDVESVRGRGRRLGLVSMRERAAAVGGTLRVESSPGRGTVIELEVPGV
jgi:signal transduction histidine kinase